MADPYPFVDFYFVSLSALSIAQQHY